MVAFKNSIEKNDDRISERSKAHKMQDKLMQVLDCTSLTSSLPVTFHYFVASQMLCFLGVSSVEGHAVKVTRDNYMVYLKDQRTPFPVTLQCLINIPNIEVKRPEMIMSSEDKLYMNRRMMRESKRKEKIKVKACKKEAERARKKWMQSEYEEMVIQIKANSHKF